MSSLRFILRSLAHHWRIHGAVALGVAAATAVLTGALLVGDSVRGSLKSLALDRLGKIDDALLADRFFRAGLADEIVATPGFKDHYSGVAAAIVIPSGSVELKGERATKRSAGVLVLGCDDPFWQLGRPAARPAVLPGPGQIVLNQPLANDLGITKDQLQGDGVRVTLRIPRLRQVSSDSALGRPADQTRALPELQVVDVIPAESLGRFSLHPSQNQPKTAYLSLASLQEAVDQEGMANAFFTGSGEGAGGAAWTKERRTASAWLAKSLRPELSDYGFSINHVRRVFKPSDDAPEEVIFDYFSFTSQRMMLDRAAENTAEHAFATDHAQGVLTYLANTIEKVVLPAPGEETDAGSVGNEEKPPPSIPYSIITAIDSAPGIGPLLDEQGEPLQLADDEIALTSWAANDLSAQPGDDISITYFDPERTHGEATERTARFKLKTIIPLTEPSLPYERKTPAVFKDRPTLANDPDLTPEVKGVTDQETISRWDPPFPYDSRRVRAQDDEYWDNHRTTPKAYVSLATGQKLWGSRFGRLTSLRVPAREGLTAEVLEEKFRDQAGRDGAALGLAFRPIKLESLAASSGTTPFDGLFLALSFFIIAAALLLVGLLFRLGIEQRASEAGTLLALGLSRKQATRLFLGEGILVAALGGLAGVAGGVAYAWLMLVGMRTIWLGAVGTPFLHLHIAPTSPVVGYVSGVIVSALAIVWSIRQLRSVPARALLAGRTGSDAAASRRSPRWGLWAAVGILLVVLGAILAAAATQLAGEVQALAFMGAGATVLAAVLVFVSGRLRGAASGRGSQGAFALAGLAARNAARNAGRSALTIGLIAAASFLIVAVSAFRLDPTEAGTGGFDLVAQSSAPIHENLGTPEGRASLLADQAGVLSGGAILSLRLLPGDDASCTNLYQAARPRVLGVPREFVEHFDGENVQRFAWAASAAKTPEEKQNPWRLLAPGGSASVPVVLDKNTAMYSLKLYRGVGEEFSVTYEDGSQVKFRVAGLLANSILQGSLLIGEEDFKRHFPRVSGYRYFLVRAPSGKADQVAQALEDRLSDQGFDATSAPQLLTDLLAVQNTYLSTFQALGGLGLLLGTFGLAAVQLRSVLERRSELALLRAVGFTRQRLVALVLLENVVLLVGGLAAGILAALVSVLPHWLLGGASVPLPTLAATLFLVLAAGLLSGLFAARATLNAPLLAALRGE